MKKFRFDCKLKRQVENVFKMFKYGYLEDFDLKGENIKYGDNKKHYYRVYKSVSKSKLTIFFIHGGGWWQGSPSLYSGVGKFFSKRGYTTVLVGYRLVPDFTYPSQIEDCFKAIRHYIDNNSDVNKIVVGGYSAGSELASHLVFDLKRQDKYDIDRNLIKGFISIAGVLDFTKCYSKASKKLIYNYIKNKNIVDSNPIDIVETNNIAVLCIHGDKDTLISVDNSISFYDKLKDLNSNAFLKIITGIDHEHAIDIARGPGNANSYYLFDFIDNIILHGEVN